MRDSGIEKHRQKLKNGQKLAEAIEKGKRNTSGFMVANGHHSLNDGETVEAMQLGSKLRPRKKKRLKESKDKRPMNELKRLNTFVVRNLIANIGTTKSVHCLYNIKNEGRPSETENNF